jgi:hypothetical protein
MISPTEYSRAGSGTETLADVLTRAPIPLTIGLKWAATVAGLLQDMHQRDCRHGKVTSANVVMRPDGPELVPPAQGFWRECSAERDVRGFGMMLYEVVTGKRAPEDPTEELMSPPAARIEGLDGVRAAAVRLAVKCMGQLPARPNMRQAAQEIRLLCLHARRMEAREGKAAAVPARAEAQPEKAEGERWMRVVREEVA